MPPGGLLLGFPGAQDGLSAYEVAVANGYVGTEAQWLASLVGPQGPTGPTGSQGAQGPQGPAGPAGGTGAAGTNANIVNKVISMPTQFSSFIYTHQGNKRPLFLSIRVTLVQQNNNGSSWNAEWLDASGTVVRNSVNIAANNANNGPDGGSGMHMVQFITLPFVGNSKQISFSRGGPAGSSIDVISVTETD